MKWGWLISEACLGLQMYYVTRVDFLSLLFFPLCVLVECNSFCLYILLDQKVREYQECNVS